MVINFLLQKGGLISDKGLLNRAFYGIIALIFDVIFRNDF